MALTGGVFLPGKTLADKNIDNMKEKWYVYNIEFCKSLMT